MKALARTLVPRSLVIAVALICVGCGAPGGSAGAAPASASTPAAVPSAAAVSTATALPSATAGPSATILPTPSASSAPTACWITDISSLRQGILVACDANDVNKNCITPGTYRLSGGPSVWPVTVTIEVPAHWFEY